ncbi:unnamed protein product [Menidia menidia]|uniref:(Atlantic silverside) hypothetical protein n=1 Tax=Menidia menidia TaxID=238744 RepID=A0A8S4AK32_9TELE|nr:unnamed protein product [Menidia menidia]
MSEQGGLVVDLKEVAILPSGAIAEPQIQGSRKPRDGKSVDGRGDTTDEEEEEEEEMASSAHLEPSTLPWPGDLGKRHLLEQGGDISGPEENDTGISGGSQDLSEDQAQMESQANSKARWRESMPEGERWRDDEMEARRSDKGDGSLADDEQDDDDEEEEEEEDGELVPEKHALGFTPLVTIMNPAGRDPREERKLLPEEAAEREPQAEAEVQFYPEMDMQDDSYNMCENLCSEKLRLVLATLAAGLLFPLLVWGGYELLPFDCPLLDSAPLRVVYTLRCSFFALTPILLGESAASLGVSSLSRVERGVGGLTYPVPPPGVLVQGVARLRYGALAPLYQGHQLNREVMVHGHFVNESVALFLFYFLQLAVMATYVSQDLVKLVPLLSIVFVFGRLIYWLCLCLGSSVRAFGFGFSFFPILAMLGANFYFVCSSVGPGSVFEVAPPTTPPPPRARWWG